MDAVSSSQLLAGLEAVQAGLVQHPPLLRVRQQLMADLAALLTGLRRVLMLDYVPGATPVLLSQVLAPLQQTLPGWQGCTLELDGCCYLANSSMLLQRLSQLASDQDSWPVLVGFKGWCRGAEPQQLQDGTEQLLQGQIQQLHAAVAGVLGAAGQYACSSPAQNSAGQVQHAVASPVLDMQQQQEVAGLANGSSSGPTSPRGWLPNVKLDRYPGLPAMPTLNGILLGYPVVYYIRDLREAAVASRMLSGSQLKLHRIVGTLSPQLSALLKGAVGQSSSKVPVLQTTDSTVLMSFTVPVATASAVVDVKVEQTMQRLQGRQAESDGLYTAVELRAACIGPQAVSL